MSNIKKTFSVLLALLLVAVFLPWGGMRANADSSNGNGRIYFSYESRPTGALSSNTIHTKEIFMYTDEQLTDGSGAVYYDFGVYFYNVSGHDPTDFWADYSLLEFSYNCVNVNPSDGDPIFECERVGNRIKITPKRYGTADIQINITSTEISGDDNNPYYYHFTPTFTTKKVIKTIDMQNWFMPENYDKTNFDVKDGGTGPIVRRESVNDGDHKLDFTRIGWTSVDGSDGKNVTVTKKDAEGYLLDVSSGTAGIDKLEGIPEYKRNGDVDSSYTYRNDDNCGQCDVVVAKVDPLDKIIYVGQTTDLEIDTANTAPTALSDGTPITQKWSAAEANKQPTGVTPGTHITVDAANKKVTGKKVGKENVKATDVDPAGYYLPAGSDSVFGYGTIYVVQPEFLIPPRVVNKDGETARKTHDLPIDEFTGSSGTKAKFLPATKPSGAESLTLPDIPSDLKNIEYTAPSSSNSVAKGVSGNTKIEGSNVGTTDITANFTDATGIDGSDTAKALVVRDYVGGSALTVGEKGWLGPENFSGITVSGETYTVTFGTPSDTSKVTVSSAGQVTAVAPTGSTPVSIPVTITRKVTVDGTEYTLTDTNECLVEVKNSPIDIKGGLIRYTGRKLNNAKDLPSDITYTYTSNGSSVTGVDLSSQLNNASWSPAGGKATVSGKSLTPLKTYDSTGNEQLTTPASSITSDDYTVKSAVLDVDIYGYEFTGKISKSYTKESKKDVDYTISLYDDFTQKVPHGSGFVEDGNILSELDRVEILDKNENPLKTELILTKGGAKDGTDYHYKSGSVVLTLEDTFLDTLDVGTYKLIGYFTPSTEGGGKVDTLNVATLKIEKPLIPGTDVSTTDATRVGGVTVLFGTSLALLLWLRKKRREQEAAAAEAGIRFSGRRSLPKLENEELYSERRYERGRAENTDGRDSVQDFFGNESESGASGEYDEQRDAGDTVGDIRSDVKYLPPKRVERDENARDFDRRARRSSPEQRERMMEERRRYYEREERRERELRYIDEMRGYYPRRRGDQPPRRNNRRGGYRPY